MSQKGLFIHYNGVNRLMTAQEITEYEIHEAAQLADQQAADAATEAAAATRASALAKLKALGLTDAEVAALIGG